MKLTLEVVCGKYKQTFEQPIGIGDKTFKWLGSCASGMYARNIPDGAIRARCDFRGLSKRAQNHAYEVILENGEIPHPMSLLQDYVLDGDCITINLTDTLSIKDGGGPDLATFAALSNTNCVDSPMFVDDSVYIQDDMGDTYGNSEVGDVTQIEISAVDTAKEARLQKAAAHFMSVILDSQMLATNKVVKELEHCWVDVRKLMPKLSDQDSEDMQNVFKSHFSVVDALYRKYTVEEAFMLSRLKFGEIVADAKIFKREEDFDELTMRVFRQVCRKETKIGFSQFLVALALLSQSRLHNTFESQSAVHGAGHCLQVFITKYLHPLASKFRLRIRDLLYQPPPLKEIRDMYDGLFDLFEKYAGKAGRDLTLSMPVEYFGELLTDSKIITLAEDEENPDKPKELRRGIAEDILTMCKGGYIKGRHVIPESARKESDMPEAPDDDFVFPEFVEGLARATFYLVDESETIMFEVDHMLDGFRKALTALKDPQPAEEVKGRGRK